MPGAPLRAASTAVADSVGPTAVTGAGFGVGGSVVTRTTGLRLSVCDLVRGRRGRALVVVVDVLMMVVVVVDVVVDDAVVVVVEDDEVEVVGGGVDDDDDVVDDDNSAVDEVEICDDVDGELVVELS